MRRGRKTSAEQDVLKLRQIEVPTGQGKNLSLACREAEISEQSCYRWCKEYGGLQIDQTRKMKDWKRENARLRRLVPDLSLDGQVLADVASGSVWPRATPAGGRRGPGEVRPLGTSRFPDRRSAPGHATLRADRAGRRGCADPRHPRPGVRVRVQWLPPRHRTAAGSGLAGGQGPGSADLASRGAQVPHEHRPRRRLWLNDGSCVRLRPLYRNHVWSFDFVQAQTHDGRSLRILTLIDEHSRESLPLKVAGRIDSLGVIEALADAMCLHGIPEPIRCDNGPERKDRAAS